MFVCTTCRHRHLVCLSTCRRCSVHCVQLVCPASSVCRAVAGHITQLIHGRKRLCDGRCAARHQILDPAAAANTSLLATYTLHLASHVCLAALPSITPSHRISIASAPRLMICWAVGGHLIATGSQVCHVMVLRVVTRLTCVAY